MKRVSSLVAIGLSLVAIVVSTMAPAAMAATNKSGTGQALEIAPPLIVVRADPGKTLTTHIKLRDITSSKLIVTNEVNDFVASGEDGTPKILLGEDNNNPFSLKNWIKPLPSFTLSPKQVQSLPVTIDVPKNASPGGHYGVIRFTGVPPGLNGSGVSLSASLGALILLTVNGKLTHKMSLNQFAVSKNTKSQPGKLFQSTPLTFTVKMKNSGNIQEEPVGHIVISDLFGRSVAGVNINVPPHNILPDSIRKFTGTLDHKALGNKKLFGLYHAKLTVVYGTYSNHKSTLTKTITFWVIPYKLVAAVIILLIVAFLAVKYLLRRYKRRILKSQGKKDQRKSKQSPTRRRRM